MSSTPAGDRTLGSNDRWLILGLCLIPALIQLVGNASPHYGYFIDEFYYLACARHLAFGYVDHPPLSPWILAAFTFIFGTSVFAVRIPAVIAAFATAALTCRLVQEFGGKRYALVVAAVAVGVCPVLLGMTSFFSMNAFEPLLWTACVLATVILVRTQDPRWWLAIFAGIGIGLENKHTLLAFVLAFALGLLLTPERRLLESRWFLAGLLLGVALVLPNLIWQATHGWPSLEFYRNAQALKNIPSPPLASIKNQILSMNPVTLPVWLSGLLYLSWAPEARRYRCLAFGFILMFVEYVLSRTSRVDRTLAGYPLLFAAGGVALESWSRRGAAPEPQATRGAAPKLGSRRRLARWIYPALILLSGLASAPITVPLLAPPVLVRYMGALGYSIPSAERGKSSPIPQLLADRTGWREFAEEVARIVHSLPLEQRSRMRIYVPDYGHAGALELWAKELDLPPVISPHNTYWHWSAGHTNTDTLLAILADPALLATVFRQVDLLATIQCDYCMNWRSNMSVHLARGAILPLESVWSKAKHYE